MEYAIIWLVFAVICGIGASQNGRSGFGYFVLAILVSPLICGFLLLALGKTKQADDGAPTPETHVRCPDCRELVLKDARKCKHCGCGLVPQ